MKNGKIVGVVNQKGGDGKSTVNTLLANCIHSEFSDSTNIIVYDLDDFQQTLMSKRNEELEIIKNSLNAERILNAVKSKESLSKEDELFIENRKERLKKESQIVYEGMLKRAKDPSKVKYKEIPNDRLTKEEKEACKASKLDYYKLVSMSSADFTTQVEVLKENYDFIFVDIPGNLKQEGVIDVYQYLDYAFIPVNDSWSEIDSTKKFIDKYLEIVEFRREHGFETKVFGFFCRVKSTSKIFSELYVTKNDLSIWKIPFLENYVPENDQAFKMAFSTIVPYSNKKGDDYKEILAEMLTILFEN